MGSCRAWQWLLTSLSLNTNSWRCVLGRWILVALLVTFSSAVLSGLSLPFAATPVVMADDDDDEDDEEEEVEIPAPPSQHLLIPASLTPEVKDLYEEAMQLYTRAQKTWVKKTRGKAIRAFKKVSQKDPEFMAPYYYLGVLYQWEHKYRDSRKILKKGIAKAPDFYELYVELGDVDAHEDKIEEALPKYQQALEIYPYFDYGLDRMSQVLIQLGRFADARPFVEKALLHGNNPTRMQCKTAIEFEVDGPKWSGATYTAETDSYIVKSNHSQDIADRLAEEIDLTRELFDKLFPKIDQEDRKYLIVMYANRESYLAGGAPQQSAGYYSPLAKRICMYVGPDKARMFKTLKHEGFHQYVDEHLRRSPAWFGEGFAEFYSATELLTKGKKRAIRLRPHKRNLEFMIKVMQSGAQTSPADLMQMTQYQMYDVANGYRKMGLHYAQAWSMIYFIAEGPNDGYRKTLKKYFKDLAKGKTQDEAYRSTFARIDMGKFEEQWISFIRKTYGEDKGI